MQIRTRIAPSPTGFFHLGTARTALFNWLYARQQQGVFVLRIEDTDKERSKADFQSDIQTQLEWLKLVPDEVYVQSQNQKRHTALLESLVASDRAYISREPSKEDPTKIVAVVRLRNRGGLVTFRDLIRGEVAVDTTDLGDFVIARTMDDPLFHFAVVVDDADEQITHVIRGEDHVSNTPRQILIQEALGFERPIYAHLPLILAPDRTKLSKRKHATSVRDFRARGYLPDAFVNFIALLGWNPGTEQEIFSREELVAAFNIEAIQKGGAVFNEDKLRWFNRMYLNALTLEEVTTLILEQLVDISATEGEKQRLVRAIRDRIVVLDDVKHMIAAHELQFVTDAIVLDPARLPGKQSVGEARKHLSELIPCLEKIAFNSPEEIKDALWSYAENNGRGNVLWPMRYALTGQEKSPDPFTVAYVLGKEKTLARVRGAIGILES